MMECFSFILKFATDQFSIESFSPLFRFSNLTHALKAVVIPGFQEFLTIMLLLRGNKGAHHLVIRCLTSLSCLPIFPPPTQELQSLLRFLFSQVLTNLPVLPLCTDKYIEAEYLEKFL